MDKSTKKNHVSVSENEKQDKDKPIKISMPINGKDTKTQSSPKSKVE